MKHFPAICIDNFYKNPDKIREFALSQSYDNEENSDGRYPGKRTKPLNEIDEQMFNQFCKKLMAVFYEYTTPVNWFVSTTFEIIKPYSDVRESIKNLGWIHQDPNSVFAGVIYLTPNADLSSGTSLFKLNDGETIEDRDWVEIKKGLHFGNPVNNYDELFSDYRNKFTETARFSNIYNRLVMFDGGEYHAANCYYTGAEPRLTQGVFVKCIQNEYGTALQRCRNQNDL